MNNTEQSPTDKSGSAPAVKKKQATLRRLQIAFHERATISQELRSVGVKVDRPLINRIFRGKRPLSPTQFYRFV